MEVNFAFLADYADNSGSKMTAVGLGIDTIYARTIPIAHPLMFAVISLQFSITELGEKRIGMCLIDTDGNNVIPPIEANINVTAPPAGFLYKNQRVALAMSRVTYNDYGDYSIRWLVEGQEVKTLSLKVSPPPAQPTTQ